MVELVEITEGDVVEIDSEPEVEEWDEEERSYAERATAPSPPPKPKPERDGVALTEDLIRRKAEHNDGCLSTLEEIALHQLDIDKIECLNNCRHLMIVYLQDNLISKLEGLH